MDALHAGIQMHPDWTGGLAKPEDNGQCCFRNPFRKNPWLYFSKNNGSRNSNFLAFVNTVSLLLQQQRNSTLYILCLLRHFWSSVWIYRPAGSSARQDRSLHSCIGLHEWTSVLKTMVKMEITRPQLRIDLPLDLFLLVNWGAQWFLCGKPRCLCSS